MRRWLRPAPPLLVFLLACIAAIAAHPATAPFGSQLAATEDVAGRVGFVSMIAAGLIAIWRLSILARAPQSPSTEVTVPGMLVAGVFGAFAATWSLNNQLVLYSFRPGQFTYVEWLSQAANLALGRGLFNVWTPYPLGTQGLVVSLQLVSNGLSAWLSSDVWTPYTTFRLLFQVVFLIVPSIASVYLVHRLGLSMSPTHAAFAGLMMAFSFAPVYYGVTELVAADPLPVACGLLAIYAVLARRPGLAGTTLGIGAVLKVIPLVLLPALLIAARDRQDRIRVITFAVLVPVLVFLPSALANWSIFASPFLWQATRPAWESWYALLSWLTNAPHEFPGPQFEDIAVGHSFGWVFWGITPGLPALENPVPPGPLRWENLVSLVGTCATLSACLLARSGTPRSAFRWAAYCTAGLLLWSPGWSPQYELYIIPFVLLAFPKPLCGLLVALVLELLTLLDYPLLLPWAYYYGGSVVWLTWGAVTVRYLLLGWICVYVLEQEAILRKFPIMRPLAQGSQS